MLTRNEEDINTDFMFVSLYRFICTEAVKVACVGNSITYGIGVSDPDKESYPARLQQMLGEGYTVERFGKPGATLLNKGHRPLCNRKSLRMHWLLLVM